MKALRIIAILLALGLMIGEAYRSWGAGRHVTFWIDDQIMGALLIAAAVALRQETPARRALFTGTWGVSAGALYLSFFSKVFEPPELTNAGNMSFGVLAALVGIAFVVSVAGFIASLVLPFKPPA